MLTIENLEVNTGEVYTKLLFNGTRENLIDLIRQEDIISFSVNKKGKDRQLFINSQYIVGYETDVSDEPEESEKLRAALEMEDSNVILFPKAEPLFEIVFLEND